jgi:pimeloyl-ACP methyl ester carboxylesterase
MTRQLFRKIALLGICSMTLHAQLSVAESTTGKVVDATVDLPSGKLFYRDSGGKGIPVIFLHSGSGNSMIWEYQIPTFIAAGYRFIAIDYRGVSSNSDPGNSNPGNADSNIRINELVNKLALPKFHLVGTAAGGGAALQYALANADKLRSIVVANSIGNVVDRDYLEIGNRLRPPAFSQLPVDFRELGPSYRATNPEGVKHWLSLSSETREPPGGKNGGAGLGQPPGGTPPSGAQPNGPPPSAGPNAVTWAGLEKLAVPTLLITGDADLYTPPSVLRMFAAHIKQAESQVISECGHSAYWENPDVFNRTVLAFISKH